jgi:hypothetical protein
MYMDGALVLDGIRRDVGLDDLTVRVAGFGEVEGPKKARERHVERVGGHAVVRTSVAAHRCAEKAHFIPMHILRPAPKLWMGSFSLSLPSGVSMRSGITLSVSGPQIALAPQHKRVRELTADSRVMF